MQNSKYASNAMPKDRLRNKTPISAMQKASRTPVTSPANIPFKPARRSGTSLHHQIFLVIRDQINAGRYSVGTALPSEQELSRQFNVSRITVRAALANLEASGFIDRQHGVGTFVAERVRPAQMHVPMSDLLAHIADVNRSTRVELRELSFTHAPIDVQRLFNCEPEQRFQRAVRIRSFKGVPIFHVITLIPESIARQFTRGEMSSTSLYQLLHSKGIQYKAGKQVVSATLADPSVASELQVEVGAPLLQIRRIHFDEQMRPFEYIELLASPTRFEMEMSLVEQDFPK
jgi:GntR family transcriptional regulator